MANKTQSGSTVPITLTLRNCKTSAVIDISGATVMNITVKGPHGGKQTRTAAHVTDGTDGKMIATFTAGEIEVVGQWKAQGTVTIPTGTFPTSIVAFTVEENL